MAEFCFDFDESKAAQVVSVILSGAGKLFDYYLLQKCLYELDREALLRWGRALIGGELKMLPWGPVNQTAMDAFKENRPGFFADCFERAGNEVRLKKNPGTSELSRAEVKLIEKIAAEWRDLSFQEAHDKATAFPECKGRSGVSWIAMEDILESAGKTASEIKKLREENTARRLLTHRPV